MVLARSSCAGRGYSRTTSEEKKRKGCAASDSREAHGQPKLPFGISQHSKGVGGGGRGLVKLGIGSLPVHFRCRPHNQQVCREGRISQVPAKAWNPSGVVHPILGMELDAAVLAQEGRLAVVLRQYLKQNRKLQMK